MSLKEITLESMEAFHKTYESNEKIVDVKDCMKKLVQDLDIKSIQINTVEESEDLDDKEGVNLQAKDEDDIIKKVNLK